MSFWRPGTGGPGIALDKGVGDAPIVDTHLAALPVFEQRRRLPVSRHRKALLWALERHRTVIVVGETGSGKTTQIPQYLHEAGWTKGGMAVVCTQPRRVAAATVAARVAQEMETQLGGLVGYSVRFEDRTSSETLIKFVTDGTLLREMMRDPLLSRYSVVMLDEAHERTVYNDVLFGLLKKVMRRRKHLRVIVSSATLDAEEFRDFFEMNPKASGSGGGGGAADEEYQPTAVILSLQGRQHPVDTLYLEEPAANYVDAAVDAVLAIHRGESAGDVLVFMPGVDEVEGTVARIKERYPGPDMTVLPLHASLPRAAQARVFEPTRAGRRRVVVATAVAETSVTVDGVRFVVDPCLARLPYCDPKSGLDSLVTSSASKASCMQRAGRAGRVSPGKCLRLLTEADYARLPARTVPEMQRTDLSWVFLVLKAMGLGNLVAFDFLSAPSAEAAARALELLYSLGALDDRCNLTAPIGEAVAELPVPPRLAKVLVSSWEFGCTEEALTVAAMLTVQHPFLHPRGNRELRQKVEAAIREFAHPTGDHATYLAVFNAFDGSTDPRAFCEEFCLSYQAMARARELRSQLRKQVRRLGPPGGAAEGEEGASGGGCGSGGGSGRNLPSCGQDLDKLRRCFVAGYFSNAAELGHDGRYRTVRDPLSPLDLHPSSVLSKFGAPPEWLIFEELVQTSRLFMRDATAVDPRWLPELAPHFYAVSRSSSSGFGGGSGNAGGGGRGGGGIKRELEPSQGSESRRPARGPVWMGSAGRRM